MKMLSRLFLICFLMIGLTGSAWCQNSSSSSDDTRTISGSDVSGTSTMGGTTSGGVTASGTNTSSTSETGTVVSGAGVAPVPEPATLLLLGAGLSGFAAWKRKFRK